MVEQCQICGQFKGGAVQVFPCKNGGEHEWKDVTPKVCVEAIEKPPAKLKLIEEETACLYDQLVAAGADLGELADIKGTLEIIEEETLFAPSEVLSIGFKWNISCSGFYWDRQIKLLFRDGIFYLYKNQRNPKTNDGIKAPGREEIAAAFAWLFELLPEVPTIEEARELIGQ